MWECPAAQAGGGPSRAIWRWLLRLTGKDFTKNWGAESSINGATAQADILGLFGRQGLDLATNTPTYLAMKLFRNDDGHKSTFGNPSIPTVAPNPDNLSAFAAVRTNDGAMTLMVINKDLNHATPIITAITNFMATGIVPRWQLTAANVITQPCGA